MTKKPLLSRIALILALLLPVYFMAAALGTKFGLWDWKTGLITLTVTAGPILIGIVALVAFAALIISVIRKPRTGWLMPLIALAIPLGMIGMAANVKSKAGAIPPVHDITTDTANPPQFSATTIAAREAADANPLNPFDVPLGQFDPWKDAGEIAAKTEAQVIAESYPALKPVMTTAAPDAALVAANTAMQEMGFTDVVMDPQAGTVEGVATTFWFGFKDDVIARIAPAENGVRIDFRSTSRVGQSDLGANAKRIEGLAQAVQAKLAS